MNFVSSSSWRVTSQSSMSMSISMLLWLAVYLLLFSSCCITTTSANNNDEIQKTGNNNNLNQNALGDSSNNNDNNDDGHGKPQTSDSLLELSEEENDDMDNGMEKLTQMKMGNDDNNDDEEKVGNDEDQQLHHSNEQQEQEQEQVTAVEEDHNQGSHDHQSMHQHKDEQHQQQGEEEEKYLHEQQEQRMNEGLQEPENSNNEVDGTNASDKEGSNSNEINSSFSSSAAAADTASSEDKDNDKETNIGDKKGQTTTSEAYADEMYCSIPDMQVLERMLTGQHDENTTTTTSSSETEQRQQSQQPSIFVVLVHKEVDCPKSKEQLSIFRKATSKITSAANKDEGVTRLDDDDTTSDGKTTGTQNNMIIKNVKFCDIPVNPQTIPLLDQLSVTHAPTIMILKQQKSSSSSDTEANSQKLLLYGTTYVGSSSTVEELRNGLQHYLSRLEYNKQNWKYQFHPVRKHQEYLSEKLTIQIDSIEELQSIVQQGELFQSVTTPLDPKLSIVEQEWIRFLLQEEEKDNTHPDPYWVICHCRTTGNGSIDTTNGLSSEFDALASVLSTRRDVAFCILKEGEGKDCPWIIQSYRIDPQDESMNLQPYSTHNYDMLEDTNYLEAAKVDLRESVSKLLRPTILWLDRQSTAPIAFAPYYKIHAVLFIDFHNPQKTKDITRNTIHEFRSTCRDYHDNEIVCLIVPSTETRILTTFGIDIWSRLDQQFVLKTQYQAEFESSEESSSSNNIMMEDTTSSSLSSLPTLLITDQRDNVGIKRYYLDPPIKGMINTFFQDVLDGNAKQEIKTSSNKHRYKVNGNNYEFPKNAYNVQLITGDSLIPFLSTSKHTLLMLYAPTCGHCKRLSIAWNALGELVTYLNWSDRLQVGRFDVSSNEFFMKGMSTKYLPEIYYFAPSTKEEEASKSPIRFHSNDIREVGSINDPLDIIDWFLDVLQAENDRNDESADDNDDVDIFMDPKALLKELQGELE